MKKFFLILIAALFIAGSANAANRKRNINPEDLPKAAIELIQKHWPSCDIEGAYEATLSNGLEIQFDLNGRVTHVDD